jgi:FKBP-type peptidyl-prolyl cis-trans isomerase FkpA
MADEMLDSNLKVEILKEGEGEKIPSGAFVSIHYLGKFLNGKQFDSSKARFSPDEEPHPYEFLVGEGSVI